PPPTTTPVVVRRQRQMCIRDRSPEVLEELIEGVEEGKYTGLSDGGLSFEQLSLIHISEPTRP
ncbi:hypothetical protein, partial [Bacillus pumilus]|uniref:hypothetical protein n=1 Tax=Bacillus pumilus TaxID=1408 RepID=UPI001C9B0F13